MSAREQVHAAVVRLLRERGVSPSFREIVAATGLAIGTVHRHVASLVEDGTLVRVGSYRGLGEPEPLRECAASDLQAAADVIALRTGLRPGDALLVLDHLGTEGFVLCRARSLGAALSRPGTEGPEGGDPEVR